VIVMTKKTRPPGSPASAGPFPEGNAARPQADGDPDFAGDRRGAAEDVGRAEPPGNDRRGGAEDPVDEPRSRAANPSLSDPRRRGDRRS